MISHLYVVSKMTKTNQKEQKKKPNSQKDNRLVFPRGGEGVRGM